MVGEVAAVILGAVSVAAMVGLMSQARTIANLKARQHVGVEIVVKDQQGSTVLEMSSEQAYYATKYAGYDGLDEHGFVEVLTMLSGGVGAPVGTVAVLMKPYTHDAEQTG